MKLSEILRLAADKYLSPGDVSSKETRVFSCDACFLSAECNDRRHNRILKFLEELGCPTHSVAAFDDVPQGNERQSARHAWLYLAALVAEDEGN